MVMKLKKNKKKCISRCIRVYFGGLTNQYWEPLINTVLLPECGLLLDHHVGIEKVESIFPVKHCRAHEDAHKEWRNKANTIKTWPNFKQHFARAYADMLKENMVNQMGYGTTNTTQGENQNELKEAIEHLANVAIHDK
eukprot:2516112-Ditylum_brightwellii.AAC.1